MAAIPKKVVERLAKGIKRFQPILTTSKTRDDGEGDTVMIVTDMLAEVFGYDKFSEVTAEFAIKSTYCDLAIKLDGDVRGLIEVKAVGTELKENHLKQAVDYAANQGVDWAVLTNGLRWRVYKVTFGKPIGQELVVDIDFCNLNSRSGDDLALLFLWCKEGWARSVLGEYQAQRQALSRFVLAATILSEPVVDTIRRELRRMSPDVKIRTEEIREALMNEVLKREVVEDDKAEEARKKLARASAKALRAIPPSGKATASESSGAGPTDEDESSLPS